MGVASLVELLKQSRREIVLQRHLEIRNKHMFAWSLFHDVNCKVDFQCPDFSYSIGVYQNQRAKQLDLLGRDFLCCQMQFLQGTLFSKVKYSCWLGERFLRMCSFICNTYFSQPLWLLCVLFMFGRLGNKVKLSWKLSSISKLDKGGYTLTYETPEGLVSVLSKSVVLTIPSYVASSLLRPLSVCFFVTFFFLSVNCNIFYCWTLNPKP